MMVRRYVKKSDRQAWNVGRITEAVDDIRTNKISLRAAETKYGIPHPTIRCHLMGLVKRPGQLGRFQAAHSDEFETELVSYILDMQQRFYGLTSSQVRSIVYELAEKRDI